jgi:hypothetical protein
MLNAIEIYIKYISSGATLARGPHLDFAIIGPEVLADLVQ